MTGRILQVLALFWGHFGIVNSASFAMDHPFLLVKGPLPWKFLNFPVVYTLGTTLQVSCYQVMIVNMEIAL